MLKHFTFDSVILGGGGSGLTSAIQLARENQNVAVISKVFQLALTQLLLKEV